MLSDPIGTSEKPRPVLRDLLYLTILCAIINTLGLTDYGVSNWQESVRLVTSRDMQAWGDWVVPTIHGVPYLAKPPLVYWCTIVLAEVTGSKVELWHLRLVVAFFGWLSVLMIYLAGRSLLAHSPGWSPARASRTAWWSALFLATGILHVRMSRTGAIDIAMVPFVIGTIWASFLLWRTPLTLVRTIALSAALLACSALAALVKGPPSIVAILAPVLGGVLGWHAHRSNRERGIPALLLSIGAFLVIIFLETHRLRDVRDALGMLLTATGVGLVVHILAGLAGACPISLGRSLARSSILTIIIGALGAAWVYSRMLSSRIGQEAVEAAISKEMGANVDILRPSAGIQLVEAASYGAGLGSIFAFVGAWAIISRRITLTPALAIIAAWVGITLVVFSAFSTGAGRYITPMWPGLALLGGIGFTFLREIAGKRWVTPVATIGAVILAIAQTWWYADGRQRYEADQSPRDFMAELIEREDVAPARIASMGFWNGGLTYYAGAPVIAIDREGFPTHAPFGAISIDRFASIVRESEQPWTLLITHPGWSEGDTKAPPDEVADAGLRYEYIPLTAPYGEKDGRHVVFAYRVWDED